MATSKMYLIILIFNNTIVGTSEHDNEKKI